MSSWSFRQAGQSDASELVALINSAYRGDSSRKGWTTEADLLDGQRTDTPAIEEILASAQKCLLVAVSSRGSIDGCVLLERQGGGSKGSAYLGMLTVRPELQARRLGRELLEAGERHCVRAWEAARIEMTVIQGRDELIAWYLRRGYRRTGERRPFPSHDPRFGLPRRPLEFEVLEKTLREDPARA